MVERWLDAIKRMHDQGYSEKEIAEKCGLSVSAFRKQCEQAKKYFTEEDD